MKRLLPKSLLGQVTLAIAVTLFLVQGINAYLAWTIEKDRVETGLVNTLSLRLVAMGRIADMDDGELVVDLTPQLENAERRRFRPHSERRGPPGARRPRRAFAGTDFARADTFLTLDGDRRLPALEERLGETLRNNGRDFADIRIVEREVSNDPVAQRFLERLARRRGMTPADLPEKIAVAGISSGEGWEIVRAPIYRPHEHFGPLFPLLRAAMLTGLLVIVLWLVLRRITGPLAQLTERTQRFSENPAAVGQVEPRGPEDVRVLIEAHNEMEARIGAMLDEKDVMLGAIGHDLKTPLAALRVRIENLEGDAEAKAKMAEIIAETSRTLDDILMLARVGRHDVEFEVVDLSALAATLVEEFEDLGKPVTLGTTERRKRGIQVTWLKRALRNLIENAIRYGGSARLSVTSENRAAILAVEDDGPGIAPELIDTIAEPFARGEASRNRATGGAGLGLAIARAVAEQHGGRLVLENREEGGLRAEIRLPL
ncbi:sensor histidine kinase [Qipengyuania sphaerica]|uniref:sensor histidine kinase n=1 Tax=Qipengyuania sphaerica TaxID=2867243 RepID=UPI001C885C0D|nr:ATP-binding protein [Qipengyuania sphaerica]MBX7539497.1 two-component sensor histidine kinase [Qipengyuania sphaerica]